MSDQLSEEKLREESRGHLRFAVIAWTMALPLMYAILIWTKIAGEFGNWWFIALYPIGVVASVLGGSWLCHRSVLTRSYNRAKDTR